MCSLEAYCVNKQHKTPTFVVEGETFLMLYVGLCKFLIAFR